MFEKCWSMLKSYGTCWKAFEKLLDVSERCGKLQIRLERFGKLVETFENENGNMFSFSFCENENEFVK